MKVRDFYNKITEGAAIVGEDASVSEIIDRMAEEPKSRTVYVLDTGGKLVGVISVVEILKFIGPRFLDRRHEIVKRALARKARDLVKHPVSVSLDDPAEKALELLISNKLEELPVCEGGKVVGDVICFELINALRKENTA
jgi:CBS domain-containing protein